MGKPKEFKMPKGKILMGNETPAPRDSADKINGERRERVMTIKPTPPKPKKVTPRPKPKGNNSPSVIYKNITPDIRYSGPATVPSLEEMRKRKQDGAKRMNMVPAPKAKPVTRRGGR